MPEPDLTLLQHLAEARAANQIAVPTEALASGGGGPHDPSMEARVAKVESDIGHIQRDISEIKIDVREIKKAVETDFRLLFGALIIAVLGLAGIMAKGFHWI